MKRTWQGTGAWLGAAALTVLLTGCPTAPRRPPAAPTPAPGPAIPAPPAAPQAPDAEMQRSAALADLVQKVEGVETAWVVVSGQEAYVGVDMTAAWTRRPQANETVERQVAQAALQSPLGIERAFVTTKPELYQSIFNIAEGLRTGEPMARFQSELHKIASEVQPVKVP